MCPRQTMETVGALVKKHVFHHENIACKTNALTRLNIESSLCVSGVAHCTCRTFETKYADRPRFGFRPTVHVQYFFVKNQVQLLDKTRAPAYHTEDSKSSARKNEPFWQILSITSYQVEYSFTGNEMNEHDQQFEWFSFLDYYHLTPPRNDLSRAGAD